MRPDNGGQNAALACQPRPLRHSKGMYRSGTAGSGSSFSFPRVLASGLEWPCDAQRWAIFPTIRPPLRMCANRRSWPVSLGRTRQVEARRLPWRGQGFPRPLNLGANAVGLRGLGLRGLPAGAESECCRSSPAYLGQFQPNSPQDAVASEQPLDRDRGKNKNRAGELRARYEAAIFSLPFLCGFLRGRA